jgi:hypothetical protein
MKHETSNTRLGDLNRQLAAVAQKLRRYSIVLFIVFVACVYGLVIWRINTLLTAQPSPEAISSQVKANSIPRVDPSVVKQLKELRDNSVNVRALFDQGRNNPFH